MRVATTEQLLPEWVQAELAKLGPNFFGRVTLVYQRGRIETLEQHETKKEPASQLRVSNSGQWGSKR
jgi:hypothetical protein